MKNTPPPCEGHSASTDLKSSTKLVVSSVIGTGVAVLGLAGLYCHIQAEKVDALTQQVADMASSVDKVNKTVDANIKNGSEGLDVLRKYVETLAVAIENGSKDNSNHQSSQKVELEALKQQLDALKKVISTEGVAVVDMQLKAQGYWDAAKKARAEGSKLAHVLYVSAMTCAENKHEIMMDYVAWRSEELGKIAKEKPLVARQLVADTAVLCDNLLSQASVSDLEKFKELSSALDDLKKRQEDGEAVFVEEKRNQMKIWKGEIVDATREKLLEIQVAMENLDVYEDLDTERDNLLQQVAWRLDCKTEHTEPLRLPVVAPGTPWVAWLKHFNDRLRYEARSVESRLTDYAEADEVLLAAADVERDDVKAELEKIQEAHGILSAALWEQEYRKRDKNNAEQSVQLLKLAAVLPEFARKGIEAYVQELRREQVDMQIDALVKQKVEFENAPKELKLQLIAGVYMQAYRHSQALAGERDLFGAQVARLEDLLTEIKSAYDGEVKAPVEEAERKRREAENRFRYSAESCISRADSHYKQAEAIADEWTSTWSNERAQKNLADGWSYLMGIDRNDLQRVAPNLHQRWLEVQRKIENHLDDEYKPAYPEPTVKLKYE